MTSTNLSLPLEIQTQAQAQGIGIEERMKVKMGRRETAGRALEVCEVVSRARVRVGEKEGRSGKNDGSVVDWGDVVSVLVTLGKTEKEKEKDGEEDGEGWEEGVKRVMDLVRLCEFSLLPSHHHLPSPTLLHTSPTPRCPPWSLPRPPFGENDSAAAKKLANQNMYISNSRRPIWQIASRCYTGAIRTVYYS